MLSQFARAGRRALPLVANSRNTAAISAQDEWSTAKPFEDMPGPKPLPLLGNAWRFLPIIGDLSADLLELQQILYNRYGSIHKVEGIPGRNNMVFCHNPDDVEKVMRNEGKWPIRPSLECMEYYRVKTRKDEFEGITGAIISQGEVWQKFRSKVNPILMQPRSTKLYIAPIDAVASDFIKRIRVIRDEKMEMPADFINELYKWALESIVYIALDTRVGCLEKSLHPESEAQRMIDSVQVLFSSIYLLDVKLSPWKIVSTPTWRRFVKASDYFLNVSMKYINQAIERLKALPEDSDRELTVLEKILARDSNPKTAVVMAMDMFFGGVDTTSSSTAMVLYNLSRNPEKQEKLFQQLQHFLPDKNQPVTSDILNELKYMKACIKESMRLRPIVISNLRTLVKDLVLSGYRVPNGTDVLMPNMLLCSRDEYFPQADKFIPERWLKDEQHEGKMQHPFVFMPFGFGPRMCVGKRFAELEIETLLAKIIRNFQVEYNYGEMSFQSKLIYAPTSPLKFKMVDRK